MSDQLLLQKATALKLYGIVAHFDEIAKEPWLPKVLEWEELECNSRGHARRLQQAKLPRFKLMADFDWVWPRKCDRENIEECLQLNFIKEATNIILCGPNGTGKTMIAVNLAYQAINNGYSALFTTASRMLTELADLDSNIILQKKIKKYSSPHVLVIDEVGYLSYSNRHADLLFEVISQRYKNRPTIITTNIPFAEWGKLFPNAACVVSLIDRLVHHSEIICIDANSYRYKEAQERALRKQQIRKNKSKVNPAM